MTCPCGSELEDAACCARYHAGIEAPTAEALMRSRYTAYVRGDIAYLTRTSHPLQRASIDARAILAMRGAWCGLTIVATADGGPADSTGMVHFKAKHRSHGTVQTLEERSRFIRIDGAWVYRDARG